MCLMGHAFVRTTIQLFARRIVNILQRGYILVAMVDSDEDGNNDVEVVYKDDISDVNITELTICF